MANLAVGTLGTADPRPVTHETLFNVFSVTKGITAAAALILKQQVCYAELMVAMKPAVINEPFVIPLLHSAMHTTKSVRQMP